MKFACFGIPHTGGTYTVYHSLRVGLAPHGINVTWLGLGPHAQAAYDDPQWAHEREHGVVVAGQIDDERQQAEALVRYLESSDFDGVIVNVLAGRVETNAIRYLDTAIRRVMIVHSITPGTYAAARAMRDHVHATGGVSPRIQSDLIRKYRFPADRTFAIPNAINLDPFAAVERAASHGPLRLLSLGRIIDADKGVFWLPKIMDQLTDHPVTMTIAGDGPDLAELKKRFAHIKDKVRFIGRVSPVDVPCLFAEHDVFISPSRFEGLPLTLVEAMATGCVPVSSRLKGVTDFVVQENVSGFLFDIGNVSDAAKKIVQLDGNRELLARVSAAARQNNAGRFDLPTMGLSYSEVLHQIMDKPPTITPPMSFADWKYPSGLRPGLRTYLPKGLKNQLRVWRERFST